MKAIVQDDFGSPEVLELREIDAPEVGDSTVLVRVRAAGVDAADAYMMRGLPYIARPIFGLRKPKTPVRGIDVAGTVEAVGADVTQLQPGDEVFGACRGSFAEYARSDESHLVTKPAELTFEQAAALPVAGCTALHALREQGGVQAGQKVLINGAGGGIGTFAVQMAKAFGAEVTGVCSTSKVELVRSLGADHVIDYTRQDFAESGRRYDLMLDIPGTRPLSDCRRALTTRGTYVLIGAPSGRWVGPLKRGVGVMLLSPFVRQTFRTFVSSEDRECLLVLKEMVESGKLTPVIDRTYALSEVPDAIRYHEEGHTRGKIVISV